jgi:EAL domain-containing protein (putative c-di-GMP-specific phosphodiesterase class I)
LTIWFLGWGFRPPIRNLTKFLADILGVSVIVEGMEGKEELDLIKLLSCGSGQGYLFSKPLTAVAEGS